MASAPRADVVDRDETLPADRPQRGVWRRVALTVGALGLALALVVGGGLWYLTDRYGGNVDRVGDVFAALDEDARPAAPSAVDAAATTAEPVTFLLVGSDTRDEIAPGELPNARSDAIMIAR